MKFKKWTHPLSSWLLVKWYHGDLFGIPLICTVVLHPRSSKVTCKVIFPIKHLYMFTACQKNTQPINPQCSSTLKLFLGSIYSPRQLDQNRQKSDPTGWKCNGTKAFSRDQGLFPTKFYIQRVLKYKGSRGSLGKLIHFPIINLHLKSSFSPLTGVRWLRKEHRKAPQNACHHFHLARWLHASNRAALWLCAQTYRDSDLLLSPWFLF